MIKLESFEKENGKRHYGMSSAAGDTIAMLNANYKVAYDDVPMPQGSDCFDYSTQEVYFFDGVAWK